MLFLRHPPSKHLLGGVIGRYTASIEVDGTDTNLPRGFTVFEAIW
jgi:hypothetical protein